MKKLFIFCAFFLMASTTINAAEKIDIQSVTNGTFAAKSISGIDPLKGTDQYAQISADGKQIVKYSFKTGKQTGVLFDVNNTIGESIKNFDGYIMSPDGKRMLIQTQTESVYRRSFKAAYYIYDMQNRRLDKLSEGGKQQVPVWSPDGLQVAFVRDNNIFLAYAPKFSVPIISIFFAIVRSSCGVSQIFF